jgi:hypothetical protein
MTERGQEYATAIVCSRGHASKRCVTCGTTREIMLCDWALRGATAGQTCDRPVCRTHARHVGTDTDYCPRHRPRKQTAPRKEALVIAITQYVVAPVPFTHAHIVLPWDSKRLHAGLAGGHFCLWVLTNGQRLETEVHFVMLRPGDRLPPTGELFYVTTVPLGEGDAVGHIFEQRVRTAVMVAR